MTTTAPTVRPMRLWPHQETALAAVTAELTRANRATVVMACGTGKTITGAEAARRLAPTGRVLIVVPTIALADQTATAYARHLGQEAGHITVICYDQEQGIRSVQVDELRHDMTAIHATVTTDPIRLAELVNTPGRHTVITTYQSLGRVADAHALGTPAWDLIIVDEAHRSAGHAERAWSIIHDDTRIPARKRLYMTATPRIMASEQSNAYSMDDPDVFGREVYRLPFSEAIERGLLANYRVIVGVVTDTEVAAATASGKVVQMNGQPLPAQMLAAQIALLKAAREYNLHRVITYHHRVASARRFADTFHAATRLLPEGERLNRPVLADSISGEDPAAHRRQILRKLELAANRLVVVSNARVLAEGVDVPELDGVMFADPRDSTTDVVQAVGRALRRGATTTKIATIVVPILLNAAESPEAALEGSQFDIVYRVVRALRAHDERLADWLDEKRVRFTTGGHDNTETTLDLPDWFTLTGASVSPAFARALLIRTVRMSTSVWLDGYAAARRYHARHGHLNPTADYVDDTGYKLGGWVAHRRNERRAGHLPADRIAMLDQLGIIWEPHEAAWQAQYQVVREFYERHGRLETRDRTINRWLSLQRTLFHKGKLPQHRIDALNALGMRWEQKAWMSDGWEKGLAAARAYHAQHGTLATCRKNQEQDGFPLGSWLNSRRVEKRKNRLSPDKIKALDELGIVWEPKSRRWEEGLAAARRYHARHGHLNVPQTYIDPEGYRLGVFVQHQRAKRRGTKPGGITVEEIAALDALGMVWESRPKRAQTSVTPGRTSTSH